MADDDDRDQLERDGWAQLFASYRAAMYGDWLDCCQMPGPLHADDCLTRTQDRGAHG